MTFFIRASVSTVSTQRVTKTRSWAWSLFILSECFCGLWSANWYLYLNSGVWVNYLLLLLYKTCFVITMILRCCNLFANRLWNVCNVWCVMLNYGDLGCMQVGLKSFMVSVDYRVYMGSSARIWSFRRLFCTCALINWSVLWHVQT